MNNKAKEELFTVRRRGSKMATQAIPLYPPVASLWPGTADFRKTSTWQIFGDFWRLLVSFPKLALFVITLELMI